MVLTYCPRKPMAGFHLLTGQRWCKGTWNNLMQRMSLEDTRHCGGSASPALGLPRDTRDSQGTCPGIALGITQLVKTTLRNTFCLQICYSLLAV